MAGAIGGGVGRASDGFEVASRVGSAEDLGVGGLGGF